MKYTLLTLILLSQSLYALVGDKGNGGDIVECRIDGKKVFKTLDSAIMESHQMFTQIDYKNNKVALNAIINHLNNTLPFLGTKLKVFWRDFENKSSESEDVLWAKAKLRQIADENLIVDIPEYCTQEPIQAVTYISNGKLHRYYYEKKQLDKIENVEDEFSWMVIHEYLRPIIKDADIIRLINGYLHSEEFLAASEDEVNDRLDKLGLESGRGYVKSEYGRMLVEARKQARVFEFREAKIKVLMQIDYDSLTKKEKKEFKEQFNKIKYPMGPYIGNMAMYDLDRVTKEFDKYFPRFEAYKKMEQELVSKINR